MKKRISFGEYDLARLYEWRLAMNQMLGESCCESCDTLEKRIAEKLGEEAKELRKLVKENPYTKSFPKKPPPKKK